MIIFFLHANTSLHKNVSGNTYLANGLIVCVIVSCDINITSECSITQTVLIINCLALMSIYYVNTSRGFGVQVNVSVKSEK